MLDINGVQIVIDIVFTVWLLAISVYFSWPDPDVPTVNGLKPTDKVNDGSWESKGMNTPEYFTEESKVGRHGAVVTPWEELKGTTEEQKEREWR